VLVSLVLDVPLNEIVLDNFPILPTVLEYVYMHFQYHNLFT